MAYSCIFLTPLDQQSLDPTGNARKFLKSLKPSLPTPVPSLFNHKTREEWFEMWSEHRKPLVDKLPKSLREWLDSAASKYGPQGARFSLSELQDSYRTSYTNAEYHPHYHIAKIGRDYLLRLFRQIADKVGYPQFDYWYRGIVGTSSALPAMLRKGDLLAEIQTPFGWFHPLPVLPGEKDQRLKHRCINQDALANVRRIEGVLNSVREWLKTYTPFFASWITPRRSLLPRITSCVLRNYFSIETDFSKCDEHFSKENVVELVLPIYELLVPDQYLGFASFVEDLFYQPIYFGDYMWVGKHNLLSGQAITNDFETIYDVEVALGTLLVCDVLEGSEIMACGDDIAVLLPASRRNKVKEVYDTMVEEFSLNGMELSLDKSIIAQGNVRFCRRAYYPGVGKLYSNEYGRSYLAGVYPDFLTLNTIINPFQLAIGAESTVSMVQRLDNLHGSPLFELLVQFVCSRAQGKPFVGNLDEAARDLPREWWERVYGEIWVSQNSPTLEVLRRSNIPLKV